jgi:hypothetical protein
VEEQIQKRTSSGLKERTQYVLTFGVIASMLYVAQFPVMVIFFFGIFAYFLWKTFSKPSGHGVRDVFEFYVSANEILRDDERRWFGFELQEVIGQGEFILKNMNGAPPLVYFTLGALYHRSGNHLAAIEHLEYVEDDDRSNENTYLHPSGHLRQYVKTLRKIEREPCEAPLMSAAVRALERARKNRIADMIEESRSGIAAIEAGSSKSASSRLVSGDSGEKNYDSVEQSQSNGKVSGRIFASDDRDVGRGMRTKNPRVSVDDPKFDKKPISEILHDIYDKNIQ